MSHLYADRERAFAVVERERAAVERAMALKGGPWEALHAQAAFLHDRVATLHDEAANLHDRVAKSSPGSEMERESRQKQAQRRLLVALWPDAERPVATGQFADTCDGRRDVLERNRLLVPVREH